MLRPCCIVCLSVLSVLCAVPASTVDVQTYPRQTRFSTKAEDHFTREQLLKGKKYSREKYAFYFLSLALYLVLLAAFSFTGMSPWLRDVSTRIAGGRWWLTVVVFAVALTVTARAVRLPITLYSSHFHEHAYGLSTRDLGMWFADYLKRWAVSMAIGLPIVVGLYACIRHWPRTWWVVASACFFVVSAILVNLAPVLIDPIFNTFKPIPEGELRHRVTALAEKAGIVVDDVFEMDASIRTRKVNAYFTGLGNTKRIVLYDTLVRNSSTDEVECVLAHEIGHWQRHHIWKGLALTGAGTALLLFVLSKLLSMGPHTGLFMFSTPADVASLSLILLFVTLASFVTSPLQSSISRHFERQADWTSLALTDDPDTFVESQRKLALRNLADVVPHPFIEWFFYSHPSTLRRIHMGETYKRLRTSSRNELGERTNP